MRSHQGPAVSACTPPLWVRSLFDGHLAQRTVRDVRTEAVGEFQSAGVAQAQHGDGDEGLGDRSHPELGVRGGDGAVDDSGAPRPEQVPAADDSGGHGGHPAIALGEGEQMVEGSGRRRAERGHSGQDRTRAGSATSA